MGDVSYRGPPVSIEEQDDLPRPIQYRYQVHRKILAHTFRSRFEDDECEREE